VVWCTWLQIWKNIISLSFHFSIFKAIDFFRSLSTMATDNSGRGRGQGRRQPKCTLLMVSFQRFFSLYYEQDWLFFLPNSSGWEVLFCKDRKGKEKCHSNERALETRWLTLRTLIFTFPSRMIVLLVKGRNMHNFLMKILRKTNCGEMRNCIKVVYLLFAAVADTAGCCYYLENKVETRYFTL
jgi:hypothetical protein